MIPEATIDVRRLRVAKAIGWSVATVAALAWLQWFLTQPPRPVTQAMRDLQDAIVAAVQAPDGRELDLKTAAGAAAVRVCVVLEYEDVLRIARDIQPYSVPADGGEYMPEHRSALVFVTPAGRLSTVHLPFGSDGWSYIERHCIPIDDARLSVLPGRGLSDRLRFWASARS